MAAPHPESADARNHFEDLSGVDIASYKNPYDALIEACENDPSQIQARYDTHRTTRNGQQRANLLSPGFSGLILDPILQRLEDPSIEPGYQDPRNCLVFWARPPPHIRSLADKLQQELRGLAPNLWLMPLLNLHMTALELTHSLTSPQIEAIITTLGTPAIESMTDYPFSHRARLIKPALSFDGAAIALSFLPGAGESLLPVSAISSSDSRAREADNFSYHHLRRDLFNLAVRTGVEVDSRYVVPSSHITLGRFLAQDDHDGEKKMEGWLKKIDDLNIWLEDEYWPREGAERREDAEWIIGQEKGLDFRKGALWYGGGETVRVGKGF
ncbi:RNA ligase/cyclic nucleotide phosphodiesterase [Amylocarpus encephaloides]|uniref:RNA ligase/cyclic nucleotide phosphodiesterase n=1 Tax=Amylocarpus encephaloides TaxID=45428 RepID=A0A9P7YTX6_9HELO|nr:RNA ligase/cyclic nucleotide phosphodiesterase [Amylocarpus encephaloides]